MKIELMNCEENILEEIKHSDITRDLIVSSYYWCIKSTEPVNWKKINQAIIKKWSRSGLLYIKKKAWDFPTGNKQGG